MKPPTLLLACSLLVACGPKPSPEPSGKGGADSKPASPAPLPMAIIGGKVRLPDGAMAARTVHLAEGKIKAIDEEPAAPGERSIDVKGATLLPAFIDSHVHITFSYPEAELQGGLAAAIDLGAPPPIWDEAPKMLPFRLYPVGQLLTAAGGYPTQGWGRDGYGREVSGVADAKAAVAEAAGRGAKMIKMPLEPGGGPLLSAEEQQAVVAEAHSRGLPVATHAMSPETVTMALAAGVDVLAHAPTQALPDALIQSFCKRPNAAVITTFYAFAVTDGAVKNVRRMKEQGCAILYGTDLGNGVSTGIQATEFAVYVELGMTPKEAIDAATSTPARYFGLSDLGALEVGKAASVIAVEGDPFQNIEAIEKRTLVVIAGQEIKE